jgi:UDP-N-acetylmuramoyl-tripeptide--D-alanyl-D-alanine ligase
MEKIISTIANELAANSFGRIPQSLPWQIVTDTRVARIGDFIWCLKGEKFDGFDFIDSLEDRIPSLVVYESSPEKDKKAEKLNREWKVPFLGFKNVFKAFQMASVEKCREYLSRNSKIVAISGANGKTTTKELLASMLSQIENVPVWKTRANNNNHIGVPMTVLEAPIESRYLILEFGSNHPGEMEVLCQSTLLSHALTTNIGDAHLEFFGTQENVFKEETLVQKYVDPKRGFWMGHNDDPWLTKLKQEENAKLVIVGEYTNSKLTLNWIGENIILENDNLIGRHNLLNLAMVVAFALELNPMNRQKIVTVARQLSLPSLNRSELKKIDGTYIFMDAYNANPSSMKSSLDGFIDWLGSQNVSLSDVLFVIGDMYELGESTEVKHRELATYLTTRGVQNVRFVGKYREFYLQEFRGKESKGHESSEIFRDEFKRIQKNYKAIFIKGSRGVRLEKIL